MPPLRFVTLDVFTDAQFAGNPLAVIPLPHDHDVSTERMQSIAREFNLSETVFVCDAHDGDAHRDPPEWQLRIFTTKAEIPWAGHPTIGAACYAMGHLRPTQRCRLLSNAGALEVTYSAGRASAAIPHNVHIHREHPFTVAELLALQPGLSGAGPLAPDHIAVVSPVRGMNFICAQLDSLATLARVALSPPPRPTLDADWNVGFAGSYFYVVTSVSDPHSTPEGPACRMTVRTRMVEGSFEDPATGSAAAALGAYLALRRSPPSCRVCDFVVTQGAEMGRPSDIGLLVRLTPALDAVERIELSGTAVTVMEGTIR